MPGGDVGHNYKMGQLKDIPCQVGLNLPTGFTGD